MQSNVTMISVKAPSITVATFVENPSTGYSWMTGTVPRYMRVVKTPYQQGVCPRDAVGCPGTVQFIIFVQMGATSGSTLTLDFYHARPYEPNDSLVPTQRYIFTVE
jgi:predicted secreted protein